MSRAIATFTCALLAITVGAAGCGGDPCDAGDGACLTVEMQGSITGIESMQVDLRGTVVFRVTKAMPAGVSVLPVQIGVLLPEASGTVTVSVVALAAGKPLGGGMAMVDVASGQRAKVIVTLNPLAGASCSDGFRDGNETDIDCGGGTCPACKMGQRCAMQADCGTDLCDATGTCVAATCSDGKLDGNETDVDCGGGGCGKCGDGKMCKGAGDCTSTVCAMGKCAGAACGDGIKNGTETDVDCGGSCAKCGGGKGCGQAGDCASARCEMNKCVALALSFADPLAYSITGPASTVAAGDLNGDGFADLVSPSTSGNLTVLVSRGRLAYAPLVNYPTVAGVGARAAAIADLNGDGKQDLAVVAAIPNAPQLSVLLGRGDGTLMTAGNHALPATATPSTITIADFNADGAPDIAIVEGNLNQIEIRLNDKMGGFMSALVLGGAQGAWAIASGDWNGDKHPDLAVTSFVMINPMPARLLLYLSDAGSGKLAPPVAITIANTVSALSAADIDGDGDLDLVAGGAAGISALLGRPKNMVPFAMPVVTAAPPAITDLAVGELTGDGKPDLLIALAPNNSPLALVPGKGDGNFGPALNLTLPAAPIAVLTADLDGDKKADLTAATANQVILFPHDDMGNYALARTVPVDMAAGAPRNPVIADINGDGKADVLAPAARGVAVQLGMGDGTFMRSTVEAVAMSLLSLVAGDWNSDGKVDIAVVGGGANVVTVALGNGDGTFAPPTVLSVGMSPSAVAAGDMNGDGKLDLVVANNGSNDVSVLLGGMAGFGATTNFGIGGSALAVAVADVTGDGKADLLAGSASNVAMLQGNGNGTFLAPTTAAVGARPVTIATADANGDGKQDVIVATNTTNLNVLINAGAGTFLAPVNYSALGALTSLSIADFNLDGRPDVVAAVTPSAPTFANPGGISVLLGAGDANGTFQPALGYLAGPVPFVVAGDVNGDGRPDVVTVNSAVLSTMGLMLNTSR